MAQPKVNINIPQKGLNRGQYNLGEADYSTLLNGVFDGMDTGEFSLSNEMSNLLSSKFKDGFKVINATNDPYSNSTYFFLVNPETGVGEYGRIKNTQQVQNLEDTLNECPSCTEVLDLATPLEDIEQEELNVYETLLTDECHIANGEPEKGFLFSIDHPIKKTVIKNEKCGKTHYFSDNNNPLRYIVIDNLQDYQITGDNVCGEDNTTPTCLDSDKLLIFKKANLPTITPTEIVIGGRLKKGVYEFLIAYSDPQGNEMSEYTSITNPIRIFDQNNVTQTENDSPTNFAIKLSVDGLDKRFSHYKIAVIQTTVDSNATRYFVEGIHTINDNTVVYGGEQNKKTIELSDILKTNRFIERAEFVTESNNSLVVAGVTQEKEVNLQPIVSLLGTHLKWQTHIALENLYENGVNTSLYGGYNRDEVVPFSIRFVSQGGYKTAKFPFVGRPATLNELEVLVSDEGMPITTNADISSILSNLSCNGADRTKRWQFYNDAEFEGFCGNENIETIPITEPQTKICYIENIGESLSGEMTIDITDDFTNLKDYLEDNKENCPDAFEGTNLCNLFALSTYAQQSCEAGLFGSNCDDTELLSQEIEITKVLGNTSIALSGTSGATYIKINGDSYLATFDTDLATTVQNFIDAFSSTILSNHQINLSSNGTVINLEHSVDNVPTIEITPLLPNLVATPNVFVGFVGVEKDFPEEYSKIKKPDFCNIHKIDYSTGKPEIDLESTALYGFLSVYTPPYPGAESRMLYFPIPYRDYNFTNEECVYADPITNITNPSEPTQGYFHNYRGADTIVELQTNKNVVSATPDSTWTWTSKVHKNALWFKALRNDREKFILEVSRQTNSNETDGGAPRPNVPVRLSIFNKCGDSTALYTEILSLNDGVQYLISDITATNFKLQREGDTPVTVTTTAKLKDFYVCIDTPIIAVKGIETWEQPGDELDTGATIVNRFLLSGTRGCFGLATRDIGFATATLSWNKITVRKKEEYRSLCTYNQPVIQDCKAVPYKYGKFAYSESTETYPDNAELFDSSTLKIKPTDINENDRADFEKSYVQGGTTPTLDADGNYMLLNTNFRCQPIRHPKFPDNKVAPFMYENQQAPFSNSIIYPLGVTISEQAINDFLDIAVNNNLLTQEKRDKIVSYEIFRGDISQDRSVLSSGLLYDMRSYDENKEKVFYSNYPFNDLGKDKLNLDSNEEGFGDSNDKFTYHSPETDYYRPALPTEMSVQGYMKGNSLGFFNEVKDHPKWVILSANARNVAGLLAGLEVATELAIALAQAGENFRVAFWAGAGSTGTSVNIPGAALSGVAMGLASVSTLLVNYGRYRYEWLKAFRDLGQPINFAYYYHGEGKYSFLDLLQEEGQTLRGLNTAKYLKDGRFIVSNNVTGERTSINNLDREKSVYLSLGKHPLEYPNNYKNYDNNNVDFNSSSLTFASESRACVTGKSDEIRKRIASPYVALKNYLPAQYGNLSSVSWLSTGFTGNLENPTQGCLSIFGGDTFITRHSLKRKIPLFESTAFGQADLTPYNYKFYSNIGKNPKFYADYEVTSDYKRQSVLLPNIDYDLSLDCSTKKGNYQINPSKFYLYYYGIPNFLTETRINTNYRTAKIPYGQNFFPNVGDLGEWTQEKNVSIREPNHFFYDDIYSKNITTVASRTLADSYNKEFNDCKNDLPNGIVWSKADNSENDISDPWLVFPPLNFFEFESSYGKLKDLRTIEREQILVRFEKSTVLYDAVDSVIDTGQRPETRNLLTSLARRPLSYSETELGFGGTQSSQSVSCEYGHFHVDAIRGQVIQIPNGGQGMEEISAFIGGKPTGMRPWFKEHLPFKILKSRIVNVEDIDLDNAYNGFGITMGYDSRFRRVFITKKDYRLKETVTEEVKYENFKFYGENQNEILLSDSDYFEDCSFTIAYSPIEQKWVGWYSYCPNYYVSHQNYFQTGLNNPIDKTEFGLWSHLLTNKSYQVFYGKKYPFILEYMLKREYEEVLFKSIGMQMQTLRYHNEYDVAEIKNKPINKMWVFSPNTHSGELRLIPNTGQLSFISKYPKTDPQGRYQEILTTENDGEWSVNYFYNRVLMASTNTPRMFWDANQIDKTINYDLVTFKGKNVLEPLRSNFLTVRLQADDDTRLRRVIDLLASKTNVK